MQSILQQSQSNPKALQEHMKNPMIKAKIQKVNKVSSFEIVMSLNLSLHLSFVAHCCWNHSH
jgi:hypothetical protein